MPRSASPFLDACRGLPVRHIPIWIMRQAGRYLPSYQKVRAKHEFLEICCTPKLAAEVTLQPVREFDFDAAIIFSDILIPLLPLGIDLDFRAEGGPRLHPAIRTVEQVRALPIPDYREATSFVAEAIAQVRVVLPGDKALIGFAGAPWTLAYYAVEGGTARRPDTVKRLMFAEPEVLHMLLRKLQEVVTAFLRLQLEAGADAVQIFDSWSGILTPEDYLEFSRPYLEGVLRDLREYPQPKILFSLDGGAFLSSNATLSIDVLSCDWRIDLAAARRSCNGRPAAFQGNLDPHLLLGAPEIMLSRARRLLEANAPYPGYIFNLGHGILPGTPVENVRRLVELVHSYRGGAA